jgi:hypothetical protein
MIRIFIRACLRSRGVLGMHVCFWQG